MKIALKKYDIAFFGRKYSSYFFLKYFSDQEQIFVVGQNGQVSRLKHRKTLLSTVRTQTHRIVSHRYLLAHWILQAAMAVIHNVTQHCERNMAYGSSSD